MLGFKKSKYIDLYHEGDNFIVFNKLNQKTYNLGYNEYAVLNSLHENKTIDDLKKEFTFYTEEELRLLLAEFNNLQLLENSNHKNKINLKKIKLRLFNPNKYINSNNILTKILFWIILTGPIILTIGITLNILFNQNKAELINNLSTSLNVLSIKQLIIIWILSLSSLTIHELAHVIVARYYQTSVPEIGIMLYYFLPYAYSNVSCIRLLDKKYKKILVLLAGIFANCLLIGIAYIILNHSVSSELLVYVYYVILINIVIIGMNCSIFLKFDLYYIFEVFIGDDYLEKLFSVKKSQTQTNNKTMFNLINSIFYFLSNIFMIVLLVLVISLMFKL